MQLKVEGDDGGVVRSELVFAHPPEVHDYGDDYWADKTYECDDLGGHHWWFSERVKGPGVTK